MKILVLGNGFDLDHNLPTSYMDFLNFCNYVTERTEESFNKLKPTQKKYADKLKSKKPNKKIKNKIKIEKVIKHRENVVSTFLPLLKNNRLLKYFNSRVATQGENWIDFEQEMKSIINELKVLEYEFKQSNQYSCKIDKNQKVYQMLQYLDFDCVSWEYWNENILLEIHEKLYCSLNDFSKALEYYISLLVNTTPVDRVAPDIVDFNADKVITFNYSNTYERIYGNNIPIDYVHGKATENCANKSNIVLGITIEDENLQEYYVEFEKYFQRIAKKTDNTYRRFISENIDKIEEVMFFGHSLDELDSDIVKKLIYHGSATAKIYYHKEQALKQIIVNLVGFLGKKNVYDAVLGPKPRIKFIQQQEHCDNNESGIRITRDINALSHIHSLNDDKINKLICNIKEKIKEDNTKETNLQYFYSQRKAISLFDALKRYDIEYADKDKFLTICETLDFEKNKNGNLVLYNESEWYHISSRGSTVMQRCDIETSLLIIEINKSNKKRFYGYELSKPYAKLLELKSSEKVKEFLLKLFEQDCPYDDYSKHLREFFKSMYENKDFFEKAFKLIEKTDLSVATKIKFKCFKKDYDEYVDNIEYQKSKQPYGK